MLPLSSATSIATLGIASEATRPAELDARPGGDAARVEDARELKAAYTQFVGEAFFGQMLKAMRQTVGEPAYFHGGQAERQFQARLDAQLAQDLASSGPDGLVDRLFASSFREQAELLEQHEVNAPLEALDALRRR